MSPGEWYKIFGAPNRTEYYHVISLHEDSVVVDSYEYHHLLQRIMSTVRVRVPTKEWMEREAENSIHPVPRAQVPFVIPV